MIKRIKVGILLMLIGIGIPLVLMFFQKDGELFSMKFKKEDRLREAEVKTLNSIVDLSSSLSDIRQAAQKMLIRKNIQFEMYMDLKYGIIESIEKVEKEIKDLLEKATLTPVSISIGIPFKYSIGLGVLLFMIGIGIVIFLLIGRKGRGGK